MCRGLKTSILEQKSNVKSYDIKTTLHTNPTEQFESLSESCYGLARVIMHVHMCLLLNNCGCRAFESMLEEERVVFFFHSWLLF